jgi:hypothetical protein
VRAELIKRLSGLENLTLHFDGWSDLEMHSLLAASVIAPDRTAWVLGTADCGSDAPSGECLCGALSSRLASREGQGKQPQRSTLSSAIEVCSAPCRTCRSRQFF